MKRTENDTSDRAMKQRSDVLDANVGAGVNVVRETSVRQATERRWNIRLLRRRVRRDKIYNEVYKSTA